MLYQRQTRLVPVLAGALLIFGCAVKAPVPALPPAEKAVPPDGKSSSRPFPTVITETRDAAPALASDAFRVMVWNVQKARDDEWTGDFRTLAADADLVLLQEAHLHTGFTGSLAGRERWDMVESWRWLRAPTGVLTASSIEPLSVRALRHPEPLLRTGKTALITEYRLADSPHTLLVANIHAINFTTSTRAFREQLIAVADLLDEHNGPVILCGDLNTWNNERRRILHEIAEALELAEVPFESGRKQFRALPLDHVFFRGLELVDSAVTPVGSSDHNPLHVTFRLPSRLPDTALTLNTVEAP